VPDLYILDTLQSADYDLQVSDPENPHFKGMWLCLMSQKQYNGYCRLRKVPSPMTFFSKVYSRILKIKTNSVSNVRLGLCAQQLCTQYIQSCSMF